MNSVLLRMTLWISLIVSSVPGVAAPEATVTAPVGIQTLTLAEALSAYHESGDIEAFQCVHVPAGKNNMALKGAKPVAVEFDEKIYLRINGKLLGVARNGSGKKYSSFSSGTTKVDVFIKKTINPSEYGESSDRLMRLTVVHGGKKFSLKTFGAACGI
ncbi:hypothetical protein [Pseudomonas sp. PDM22]|uniref:hypothetical protein n=1 Tax=Pseudomonas sp. PDM22 TaxID=2769287 RepID=UPI00111C2620|nr:hypothetical protein [Pseudomonas sp. PDM22]MBD9516109.1 hypothetical protein [Pseudomonas sp. PDM22]